MSTEESTLLKLLKKAQSGKISVVACVEWPALAPAWQVVGVMQGKHDHARLVIFVDRGPPRRRVFMAGLSNARSHDILAVQSAEAAIVGWHSPKLSRRQTAPTSQTAKHGTYTLCTNQDIGICLLKYGSISLLA